MLEYETLLREKLRDSSSPQAELEEAGVRMIVLHVLKRRVGVLPKALTAKLANLSIAQIESLAEALLDFQALSDLEAWLTNIPK